MKDIEYRYSQGDRGHNWLMVANLDAGKGDKRTRRLAMKIYRWQRKQYYRPLIHKGKAPR